MVNRERCWEYDALSAVSLALYLYLAFGAVHAWAHVDEASRALSQLLYAPGKALHTMASPCRWAATP